MAKGRPIRCYDYVNHPYEQVRNALTPDAAAVFQAATKAAASRAHSVASKLYVNIAGMEVGTDVTIAVKSLDEQQGDAGTPPITRIELEWEAANSPRLFPLMKADLSVYPLTTTETQLDFSGLYEPPLGALGDAIDAAVGHRIAEASVHRFVADVAGYLRTVIADAPDG